MEHPIFHTQRTAQNAPKVIKVVNLKQFMPGAPLDVTPKLKRTWHEPVLHTPSNIDVSKDKVHVQNCVVEKDKVPENQDAIDNTSDTQNGLDFNEKQVLSNGRKVKFRNCLHTQEELSRLHECTDDTLVKVGNVFDSRESFKQYLNDNAKRWHYYYVCRNSKKTFIEYNCICMAYNIKEREVVIRKHKKRTTACPCKVRLAINQANKVIVYYVCNHHDHPTTASEFHHYPHAKYLPQHVKEEFLDLTYLGVDVDLIQKYIHSLVGLTLKKTDITSYAYRFKRKIFNRSMSEERQIYMNCLIAKIRDTYDPPLETKQHGMTNEHTEAVLSIKDVNLRQETLKIGETDNPMLRTLTDDVTLKYSTDLLNQVLEDTTDNTEVTVQYVNEEGILCDEYGSPVANSSAVMQFVDNHAYVPGNLQQPVISEINNEEDSFDFVRDDNTLIYENEPYAEQTEGAVLNDVTELLDSNIGLESSKQDETVICDSYKKRLSPTPDPSALYAEMDNFKKYYYVDHRYIPYEGEERNEKKFVKHKANSFRYVTNTYTALAVIKIYEYQRSCFTSSTYPSGLPREEFIKAPDFVYHPTPIRHCSGHEHLTLLTDEEAIFPGARFLTHDVFLAYINRRASRWFFYYSLMESGKAPEHYVYKCVYGKTRVSKNAYRAKGLRKRNKLTTQCPCQIRLRRLESDPTYLTVLYSCNHHDHKLDSTQFTAQQHTRRLPSAIKEEVKDLITLGAGADVLRRYVFAETGVRVYGKYFQNVRTGMKARREVRHYTEERIAALTKKIRDLEVIYGTGAKENPQARQRILPNTLSEKKECITRAGQDENVTQIQEYCELSDDDFAEEVYIMETDTLPQEDTAKQSRLETRPLSLPYQEMPSTVPLQESVRCDGVRTDMRVVDTSDLVNIGQEQAISSLLSPEFLLKA